MTSALFPESVLRHTYVKPVTLDSSAYIILLRCIPDKLRLCSYYFIAPLDSKQFINKLEILNITAYKTKLHILIFMNNFISILIKLFPVQESCKAVM